MGQHPTSYIAFGIWLAPSSYMTSLRRYTFILILAMLPLFAQPATQTIFQSMVAALPSMTFSSPDANASEADLANLIDKQNQIRQQLDAIVKNFESQRGFLRKKPGTFKFNLEITDLPKGDSRVTILPLEKPFDVITINVEFSTKGLQKPEILSKTLSLVASISNCTVSVYEWVQLFSDSTRKHAPSMIAFYEIWLNSIIKENELKIPESERNILANQIKKVTSDLSKEYDKWAEQYSMAHDKNIQAIIDLDPKTSLADRIKNLVKNNQRTQFVELINSLMPWENMSPSQASIWKEQLEAILRPNLKTPALVYRGSSTNAFFSSDKQARISLPSRLLNDLDTDGSPKLEEQFRANVHHKNFKYSNWMNRFFKTIDTHAADGMTNTAHSPYLSVSSSSDSAAKFIVDQQIKHKFSDSSPNLTMWKVDPRRLIPSFGSVMSNESEYLVPLALFPDEIELQVDSDKGGDGRREALQSLANAVNNIPNAMELRSDYDSSFFLKHILTNQFSYAEWKKQRSHHGNRKSSSFSEVFGRKDQKTISNSADLILLANAFSKTSGDQIGSVIEDMIRYQKANPQSPLLIDILNTVTGTTAPNQSKDVPEFLLFLLDKRMITNKESWLVINNALGKFVNPNHAWPIPVSDYVKSEIQKSVFEYLKSFPGLRSQISNLNWLESADYANETLLNSSKVKIRCEHIFN